MDIVALSVVVGWMDRWMSGMKLKERAEHFSLNHLLHLKMSIRLSILYLSNISLLLKDIFIFCIYILFIQDLFTDFLVCWVPKSKSYKKFKMSNGIKRSSRVLEIKLFDLIGNKYSIHFISYHSPSPRSIPFNSKSKSRNIKESFLSMLYRIVKRPVEVNMTFKGQ